MRVACMLMLSVTLPELDTVPGAQEIANHRLPTDPLDQGYTTGSLGHQSWYFKGCIGVQLGRQGRWVSGSWVEETVGK
jgi:hypothetical protein